MAKPKTIRVRIAVAVDAAGDWAAAGWRGAKDSEALEAAIDAGAELAGCYQVYYLSVEVPAAKPIELSAAGVEEGPLVTDDTGE
jgi:hypothetical protein